VMLGAHELVERTVPAHVVVICEAGGEPIQVEVHDARRTIRGGERSPYV
jgi:hypothetical protein